MGRKKYVETAIVFDKLCVILTSVFSFAFNFISLKFNLKKHSKWPTKVSKFSMFLELLKITINIMAPIIRGVEGYSTKSNQVGMAIIPKHEKNK